MIEILYSALNSELGIVVEADVSPETLRQRLYEVRVDLQDAQLNSLSFHISRTDPNQLWIVKNAPT